MTTSLPRARWRPTDDYDEDARWQDDRDDGWRWQAYGACRADDVDPDLFFPVKMVSERRTRHVGNTVEVTFVEVPTDEEPAYPSPEVREICGRCPVAGRCLERNMDMEFGVFGGTTGYQRGLMTKRIVRKHCMICGGTDLVLNSSQKKEACLACGHSWDVL